MQPSQSNERSLDMREMRAEKASNIIRCQLGISVSFSLRNYGMQWLEKKEEEEVACFARNFWVLPDALPQTEADGFQFFPSLVGKRKETVNVEQQQRKQITVEWRMRCLSASSMSSSSPFRKSLTASKAHNAFSRSTVIYRRSACIRFSLNFAHESEASFTFSFPYISRWFSFLRSCLCNTTTVVATRPSEAGQLNMRMWLWSAYVRHAATGKKAVRWMRDGYTFFEPS